MEITETKKEYNLKEGTKTAWKETETEERIIPEEWYTNSVDAAPFFRRLGGSETLQREYTCRGYKVVRIISKSPDRQIKVIREYSFK